MKFAFFILCLWIAAVAQAAEPATGDLPRVALFPIAGDAAADLREKVAFSIRQKLSRDKTYDVIEGVTMADLAGEPAALSAKPTDLQKLVAAEKPAFIIWGELTGGTPVSLAGSTLRLKLLDLRQPNAKPIDLEKKISDPTDLRFVAEEIVQKLPSVKPIGRPNEEPVIDDEQSKLLWEKNPNLIANGNFAKAENWQAILQAQKYPVRLEPELPAVDKVSLLATPTAEGQPVDAVLAMRMSQSTAEGPGLACLSDPIPITRVFVKGYTNVKAGPKDEPRMSETFRTQVPPTGPTAGNWQTVVGDVNPFHPSFQVQELRVDLYTYGGAGVILWDDVVVKEVGPLTKTPKDEAIEKPVTRPASR